jgi:hypothetical protein
MEFMRLYLFKFLPLGFFPRLLVRYALSFAFHVGFSDTSCSTIHLQGIVPLALWKNGMLLKFNEEYMVLFEYNQSLYRLRVQIRVLSETWLGENIRLIWENIDALCSGWFPGMLKGINVACAHCLRERSYDPFFFTLNDLEVTVAKGFQYAYCRSIRPVRIDLLASEVALADVEHLRINFADITVRFLGCAYFVVFGPPVRDLSLTSVHQQLEKEVGAGSFAKVYKGRYKDQVVAVKKVNFSPGTLHLSFRVVGRL